MKSIRRVVFSLAAIALLLGAADLGYRMGAGDGGGLLARLVRSNGSADDGWLAIPLPQASFKTLEGEPVSLTGYDGQVVLLNFWGTWCPPCLREIPHLVRVQEFLQNAGGTIIGPAVDSGSKENILRFAEAHGINYPIWVSDYDTAVGKFGALGYPFTVLIDRRGMIRKHYLGPQTSATLVGDLRQLLAEEAQMMAGTSSSSPSARN